MKKKSEKGRSAVMFNRDVSPGMTGLEKAGVARPNLKRGAAAVKGSERGKKRSKKRD